MIYLEWIIFCSKIRNNHLFIKIWWIIHSKALEQLHTGWMTHFLRWLGSALTDWLAILLLREFLNFIEYQICYAFNSIQIYLLFKGLTIANTPNTQCLYVYIRQIKWIVTITSDEKFNLTPVWIYKKNYKFKKSHMSFYFGIRTK